MTEAFICDAVRTPIGRYGGALSSVRADDLAALPIKALMERNPDVDVVVPFDKRYERMSIARARNLGELNRVLTDHASDLLLCSTQTAVDNLEREAARCAAEASPRSYNTRPML